MASSARATLDAAARTAAVFAADDAFFVAFAACLIAITADSAARAALVADTELPAATYAAAADALAASVAAIADAADAVFAEVSVSVCVATQRELRVKLSVRSSSRSGCRTGDRAGAISGSRSTSAGLDLEGTAAARGDSARPDAGGGAAALLEGSMDRE